jgi:ATP-dependent helicase/nuclease subunit B
VTLQVVWSSYGADASLALRDAVTAAKAGEPLAPVTVVVPSNHVGVASRRLLASGSLGPGPASGSRRSPS